MFEFPKPYTSGFLPPPTIWHLFPEATASETSTDDLRKLFNVASNAVEETVRKSNGDLFPWIEVLKDDGSITGVLCPPATAEEAKNNRERVNDLAAELMSKAKPKAIAIIFDVRFQMTPADPPRDAIQLELLTPSGTFGRFLRPYKRHGNQVTFDQWKRLADSAR